MASRRPKARRSGSKRCLRWRRPSRRRRLQVERAPHAQERHESREGCGLVVMGSGPVVYSITAGRAPASLQPAKLAQEIGNVE